MSENWCYCECTISLLPIAGTVFINNISTPYNMNNKVLEQHTAETDYRVVVEWLLVTFC